MHSGWRSFLIARFPFHVSIKKYLIILKKYSYEVLMIFLNVFIPCPSGAKSKQAQGGLPLGNIV